MRSDDGAESTRPPLRCLVIDLATGYAVHVKFTDQPEAKLKIWARERRVVRIPRIANLPRFGSRKFDSYAEFNSWKEQLLLELVRNGGARWTP